MNRSSFMNDVKWWKVLYTIQKNQIPVRVKLLWHQYVANVFPGAEVIVSWDEYGNLKNLSYNQIFHVTGKNWESSELGPFKPSDIDWLEMDTSFFENVISRMNLHIQAVSIDSRTVILGYEM